MGHKRPRSDEDLLITEGALPTHDQVTDSLDEDAKRIRRREQKAAKRARLLAAQQEKGGLTAIVTPQNAVEHPFEALAEDAAETPFEAYRDLEPMLFRLALDLKKSKETLRIYDPFYAAGSVVKHLARLGFTNVYNKNEDFYAVVREGRTPPFDVLVTNPPFSGDHMKRTLDFALSCGKPFLLLLPEFVEDKKYYVRYVKAITEGAAAPLSTLGLTAPVYLGPSRRAYQFSAPGRSIDGVKAFVERTHHAELPFQVFACSFQCVWYLQLGVHREALVPWWRKKYEAIVQCALSETTAAALPQLSKAGKAKAAAAAAAAADGTAADAEESAEQNDGAADAKQASTLGSAMPGSDAVIGTVEEQGQGGMSRNAWRKKVSRQRKQAAKVALGIGPSAGTKTSFVTSSAAGHAGSAKPKHKVRF